MNCLSYAVLAQLIGAVSRTPGPRPVINYHTKPLSFAYSDTWDGNKHSASIIVEFETGHEQKVSKTFTYDNVKVANVLFFTLTRSTDSVKPCFLFTLPWPTGAHFEVVCVVGSNNGIRVALDVGCSNSQTLPNISEDEDGNPIVTVASGKYDGFIRSHAIRYTSYGWNANADKFVIRKRWTRTVAR